MHKISETACSYRFSTPSCIADVISARKLESPSRNIFVLDLVQLGFELDSGQRGALTVSEMGTFVQDVMKILEEGSIHVAGFINVPDSLMVCSWIF